MLILENDGKNAVIKQEKIAIVMALYYEEDVSTYFDYLAVIPQYISIFIISSKREICKKAVGLQETYKNLKVLEKENRGRDLSALLVSFRPYAKDYEYICFLHDKKPKHESLEEDLSLWIENLWGNMIYSKAYIAKAVSLLRDDGYGMLLPPKPIGTYRDSMYTDPWDNDYENVVQLAQTLHIEEAISRENKAAVSLGSVFWCRACVLDKLFSYHWKYEDFPQEPMADDGTISHAIERIFGFLAIDAGYKTTVIMNVEYAAKMVMLLQGKMQDTYEWLWNNMGIKNTYQLSGYYEEKENVSRMFGQGEVYLYGAGDYGIQYLQKLRTWGYEPKGFVVSDGQKRADKICGQDVKELSQIDKTKMPCFIITTNPALQEVLASNLEKKGFFKYYKAVCM